MPRLRITLSPVCPSFRTMTLETSTPRCFISSSMKRPKTSSPHTPMNATFSPSRAAPQAKILSLRLDQGDALGADRRVQPVDLVHLAHHHEFIAVGADGPVVVEAV